MGRIANYDLELTIRSGNIDKALMLFNELHTDEMLLKHAQGGLHGSQRDLPIRERRWFSWVANPKEPYRSIEEAFSNWGIVDDSIVMEYNEEGDFFLSGTFEDKIGQQKLLLQQLAEVLEDLIVYVKYDDYGVDIWSIQDHQFYEKLVKKYF